jgi:hypothetical protein
MLARRDVLASKRFASQPRGQAVHELAWQDYPAALDVESRLSRLCWRLLQCEKLASIIACNCPIRWNRRQGSANGHWPHWLSSLPS